MMQLDSAKRWSGRTGTKPLRPIPIRVVPPRVQPLLKSGCACGGGCPTCKTQAQSPAGPDHPSEREADAVAARVMSMPGPASVQRMDDQTLMRQPEADEEVLQMQVEEEEEEEEALQMQAEEEEEGEALQMQAETGHGVGVPVAGDPVVGLGVGRPLPGSVRRFFEPRFGRSFANVRIHDGPAAQARAKSLKAQAFTFGRNIVFGPGRYSPDNAQGRLLLAHELTHVVQQRKSEPASARVNEAV